MKIVKIKGGLGNQMFQYSFARLLQEKYHCEDVKLDFSYYGQSGVDNIRVSRLKQMNVCCTEATGDEINSMLRFSHKGNPLTQRYRIKVGAEAIFNKNYYFEKNRAYRDPSSLLDYLYFDGYWQSWRYLEPIKDILKKEFSCTTLSLKTQSYINRFNTSNTVFVGVRRGDYLSNDKAQRHYGNTDMEYYKRAVNIMIQKLVEPIFVFFSNDIEWVKNTLTPDVLCVNSDSVQYREDVDIENDFEELFVMSACKNAIISNSTFNFWGAWLIDNPKKAVIVPEEWFKDEKPIDIVPDGWIRL